MFLYIDPLKQGLKHENKQPTEVAQALFLYIDPLKQGLKLKTAGFPELYPFVFIHRSIKTRIETGGYSRAKG